MISDDFGTAANVCTALNSRLRPSAAALSRVTGEAASRAAAASQHLARLDREQSRLRAAMRLFAEMRDLQAIIGRLEAERGAASDDAWLELVERAVGYDDAVLDAYAARYGADPRVVIAQERERAQAVLMERLEGHFRASAVSGPDSFEGLRYSPHMSSHWAVASFRAVTVWTACEWRKRRCRAARQ